MAKASVTALRRFVDGCRGQEVWAGVDVHKRSYSVALRREDGQVVSFVTQANPGTLIRQFQEMGMSLAGLAYEAGPTGYSLAREATGAGIPTFVGAPCRIPRPVTPGAKTDRLDCVKLAGLASRGMIPTVTVPTPVEEAQRSLLRRRHQLSDSLRRVKQRIKSLLLFLGLPEPPSLAHWGRRTSEELRSLPMEPSARQTLESHLRALAFTQAELKEVDDQIAQLAHDPDTREVVRYLRTVPGVGPVVSSSFALELFRPERFHRAEEVTSYLGLAPMVNQSGEKTPKGRLRQVGQTRLRALLLEAAWIWQSKDREAGILYRKLLAKTGIPQKAIAAVARKLAVILWRISVERRPYRAATM